MAFVSWLQRKTEEGLKTEFFGMGDQSPKPPGIYRIAPIPKVKEGGQTS